MNRRKLLVPLVTIMVVAFGGLAATLIAQNKPSLGLDLQGGISVTQQPIGQKGTDYNDEALDLAVERIRDRVDSLGVAEPEILRQGDAIVVNLPGVKDQQQAIDLVQVTGQVYLRPVQGCTGEGSGDTTTTTAPDSSTSAPTGTDATATTVAAPSTTASPGPARRVSSVPSGSTEPSSTEPGSTEPTSTSDGATTTTDDGGSATTTTTPAVPVSDPTKQQVLPVKGGGQCLVNPSQGTGSVFKDDARADIIQGKWGVSVGLRQTADGVGLFNSIAAQCKPASSSCPSGRLAIELDGLIISAPAIQQPNFTQGVDITGNFTEQEARDLARVLKSGSLPVRMQTQSVQNVSPTLGDDSLHAAIVAGLVGVALVFAFLVLYYRRLGLVVVVGVLVSFALLYTLISFLSTTQGLTLSLSGIAGIIVSVGVTVDSYVVFFERLKDEVSAGRSLRNSAQRGFKDAWRTILIADTVSLIGAFTLWYLTVGSVRNFAFFLGLSTLMDLIVSYCFTRPAVLLLTRTDLLVHNNKVLGIELAAPTSASGSSPGSSPGSSSGKGTAIAGGAS